jgi:DNA-directed RNA polymerase subunit RPC12/RpoP
MRYQSAMKKCPSCLEPVQDAAIRCPHCGSRIVSNGEHTLRIGGVIIVVLAMAYCVAQPSPRSDTANTIIAAHKACDAQTGQHCR